jgi:hypothetical protein
MMDLEHMQSVSFQVAQYLRKQWGLAGAYPARSLYGEPFSVLLWSFWRDEFDKEISGALRFYSAKKKTKPEFHWEFNNYALLHYRRRTGERRVDELLQPLRFRGTPVTNWTLLRSAARFAAGHQRMKALCELTDKLRHCQLPSGQILDDSGVKSFQYHCFSAALLAELSTYRAMACLRRPFVRAVDFIRHFILPNGDTLYIGRGQEQSFGYGALLYILAEAYQMTQRAEYLADLAQVWDYVCKFQRDDGSFPLVFSGIEDGFPAEADANDARYPGWYPYNNYFDYLPFFGCFLARTAAALEQSTVMEETPAANTKGDYGDDSYRVVRRKNYTAVLAVPGGYWTNDMPFPYVCFNGESVFPCYGGEQFQESLYSVEGIPLPWGLKAGQPVYLRERLRYRWCGEVLVGEGSLGTHRREFEFGTRRFTLRDHIRLADHTGFDLFYPIHLLFHHVEPRSERCFDISRDGQDIELEVSMPCLLSDKVHYCARGELRAIQHRADVRGKSSTSWDVLVEVRWSG